MSGVILTVVRSPIALPEGCLACHACGVAVEDVGQERVTVEASTREGEPPRPAKPVPDPPVAVTEFLLCPVCENREDVARVILSAHPDVWHRLGTGREHHVADALTACAALYPDLPLGLPETDLSRLLGHDEVRLWSLLGRMAPVGAVVAWGRRFGPVLAGDARLDTGNPAPWAHLSKAHRARLGAAYAHVLADRVSAGRPDVHLSPPFPVPGIGVPVPRGCLLCGVGSVVRSAVAVQAAGGREHAASVAWEPLSAPTGALGGRATPDGLSGHLCPVCADVIRTVGSVGMTAMERSLSVTLAAAGRDVDAAMVREGLEGLVAWGVLAGRDPKLRENVRPWAHLTFTGPGWKTP